jgi:uncharacterized protein with HEPN domain
MWRDEAYLLDILLAARRSREFITGLTREAIKESKLHQDAIMRTLEIIGEAAGKVSQETKNAHPEIPWNDLIGMRNRLIHEYFRIDLEKVWDTVQKDIPALITLIEPLVPPKEPSS